MEIIDVPQNISTVPTNYAGFWLRFVAYLLDAIILNIVLWVIVLPMLAVLGFSTFSFSQFSDFGSMDEASQAGMMTMMATAYIGLITSGIVLNWLYYSLMESSTKQATLGKMALNIKVTDMQGNRITFLNATGRYFGKIISSLIMGIGYIMAGFTEKKQALHDIMAGTLVVVK